MAHSPSGRKLFAQNKAVAGKTSLIVGTTYIVTELVNHIKDGSLGTETNMKWNCFIIFVLEWGFLAFPGSRSGRNKDMKGLETHD